MRMSFFFLVAIFLVNAVGLFWDWYLNYFWFDITLHFLGGFFVAMLMAGYLKEYISSDSKLKSFLIILGATAFIGVIWEFAEYIANQTLMEPIYKYLEIRVYFMGNLDDTLNDLMMDILGALIFCSHLLRRGKSQL